jgi:dTDP-glucose 4,6-dehydratase/UDP-glucose 4-epimerase
MQNSFQDKNVLITGGAGFIGSNLARALLKEGAKITIVDSMIPQYGGNFFNIADIQEKVKFNISDARDSYSFDYLIKNQHYLLVKSL